MMVGIVTLPMEIKYFGRKAAVMRNLLAFFFSFTVAFVIALPNVSILWLAQGDNILY